MSSLAHKQRLRGQTLRCEIPHHSACCEVWGDVFGGTEPPESLLTVHLSCTMSSSREKTVSVSLSSSRPGSACEGVIGSVHKNSFSLPFRAHGEVTFFTHLRLDMAM